MKYVVKREARCLIIRPVNTGERVDIHQVRCDCEGIRRGYYGNIDETCKYKAWHFVNRTKCKRDLIYEFLDSNVKRLFEKDNVEIVAFDGDLITMVDELLAYYS